MFSIYFELSEIWFKDDPWQNCEISDVLKTASSSLTKEMVSKGSLNDVTNRAFLCGVSKGVQEASGSPLFSLNFMAFNLSVSEG